MFILSQGADSHDLYSRFLGAVIEQPEGAFRAAMDVTDLFQVIGVRIKT